MMDGYDKPIAAQNSLSRGLQFRGFGHKSVRIGPISRVAQRYLAARRLLNNNLWM